MASEHYRVVNGATGNDGNDGYDNLGLSLTNLTWDLSEFTLTGPAASFQQSHVGQHLYFTSAADPYPAGAANWLKISSVNGDGSVATFSSAQPYAVSGVLGDCNDAQTSDGPWATIDNAMNNVVDRSTTWVANGTYNETATIDTKATDSTEALAFRAFTDEFGDDGTVTVDGQDTRASCLATTLGAGSAAYYLFEKFEFTGATGVGAAVDTLTYLHFRECKAYDNGSYGFETSSYCVFEDCEAYGNGNAGVQADDLAMIYGGSYHDNAADRQVSIWRGICSHVTVYGIKANKYGIYFIVGYYDQHICNCTIDGEGVTGVVGVYCKTVAAHGRLSFVNNIVKDCSKALEVSGALSGEMWMVRNNCLHNCSLDYVGFVVDSTGNNGDISSDPLFTDEAGHDYTLLFDSPARGAGYSNYTDMGAHQRRELAMPPNTGSAF